MREDVKPWVRKAEEDYDSAKILQEALKFDTCCYHFQQAAEKYLKALIVKQDIAIPRKHDLEYLISIVKDSSGAGTDVLEACLRLTGFSILTRYPGYDAGKEDASLASLDCTVIRSFCLDHLDPHAENMNIFDK